MLASDLELVDLLNFCQSLETENGRIRTNERWISRTLDIDILALGFGAISIRKPDSSAPAMSRPFFRPSPLG